MLKKVLSLRVLLFLLITMFCGELATKAQENIDSLKTRLNQSISEEERFFIFRELGSAYGVVNGDSAIYFSNKAYQLGLYKENKELQMLALITRGNVYFRIDNPELALQDYFQCKALAEELGSEEYIQKSLNNIANVYENLGDFKKAIGYYENALEVSRRLGDKLFEGMLLNNIGNAYGRVQNYEQAFLFLHQAEEIYKQLGAETFLNQTWNNIGLYKQESENYEEALHYFKQSLNISDKLDQIHEKIRTLNNIGELYMMMGDNPAAEKHLLTALQLNKEGQYARQLQRTYRILSVVEAGMKKTDSLKKFYDIASILDDSLNKVFFNKKIASLKVRYETEQKEQQIEQLRLEKNFRGIIIGILILTTILSVILYFVKKQKSRTELDLLKKNLEAVELDKRLAKNEQNEDIAVSPDSESSMYKDSDSESKYKNSALSPDLRSKLISEIRYQLESEKIYLQSDLTMDKLCELIKSNKTYASQILNEEYGKSFSTLINELRVKEARRKLADAKYDNLSIEGLAMDVGFNSGNRFHKVFKKFTGLTPAQFKKLLEKEQSKSL